MAIYWLSLVAQDDSELPDPRSLALTTRYSFPTPMAPPRREAYLKLDVMKPFLDGIEVTMEQLPLGLGTPPGDQYSLRVTDKARLTGAPR